MVLSFVAGVLVGVALLHMLPHAVDGAYAEGVGLQGVFIATTIGFVVMFLLERFACFHHHEEGAHDACSHGEHRLSWVGAFIGLSLHTLIAGAALGASVAADSTGAMLAGFGTFLAILLHKPFDALTITTLMQTDGASRTRSHVVNGLFALVIPLGVGLFFALDGGLNAPAFTAWALAFCAGTFLCIGCADLLPELQFHSHDRIKLSLALLLGLVVAWAAGLLEHAGHNHSLDAPIHQHEGHSHP